MKANTTQRATCLFVALVLLFLISFSAARLAAGNFFHSFSPPTSLFLRVIAGSSANEKAISSEGEPAPAPPLPVVAPENCANGIDDDADGLVDGNDPDCGADAAILAPAGSFIIDMGVQPQTVGNAIKPYGLVWHLLHELEVPVVWSINPNKGKDGADFTYNGIPFKGGPFIILAEYRTPEVNALIANWQAQGVVGVTTTSDLNVPLNRILSYSMNWTLNQNNGQIAQAYLDAAGIPSTAYNWTLPQDLNCCNDVFLMPHSEPTWQTHNRLLSWNASTAQGGCAGALWAGCKAGSEVENIVNPANSAERMNFLMLPPVAPATSPAVWSGDHDDGTIPYSYFYPVHPVMQFLGIMDGAQENGAEQIYLPTNNWRPTTFVAVTDPDHPEVPSLSPGPAAKLAFGPAFGDPNRGFIMYQTAHRLDKASNPENIAAQRAFFNFSMLAVGQKAIKVSSNIPDLMVSNDSYTLTATATGGSGNYYFHWESSCPGTFSNPYSSTTTFTAGNVVTPTECNLKVTVTDDCGARVGFSSRNVTLTPQPTPPVAMDDYEQTQPGSPVTVNALANDSDPNLDPLTLTNLLGSTNTGNGVFVNDGNGQVTYTPNFNFTGIDQISYQVCDNTPPADGGPLCDTATIFITVDWTDSHGCLPNQYFGTVAQGNATAVLAQNSVTNSTQALGAPALVASSNTYYAKIDADADYLVLDLGYNVPVGDTIWLHIGSDDGGLATLQVTSSLTGTAYSTGVGFSGLTTYSTSKDLNAGAPQQDVVAYVPATAAVRKLRFKRSVGAGKPCVNGVIYVDKSCLSAVPVANNDAVTLCEDNTVVINVLANDTDPQGLPLTVGITTPPANGTATVLSDGTIRYKPNADYSGADNFTYQACNSNSICDPATVSITIYDDGCPAGYYKLSVAGACSGSCILSPNNPPDAVNDFATTSINTPINIAVQSNDLDPSGLGLTTYLGFSNPPDNGSVALEGSFIRYTPNSGFVGQDVFNYVICNAFGCDSALVTVDVLCVDPQSGRAIQGMVFQDLDKSATFNNGEPGFGNIRVRLYKDANSNGQYDAGETQLDSALTDSQGNYDFYLGNGSVSNSSSTTYYPIAATGSVDSHYPINNAIGAPNGDFVKLNSGKYVVLEFASVIPVGTSISIVLASDKKAGVATVSGSLDGSTFSNPVNWSPTYTSDPGNPPPASAFQSFNYTVSASGGIRFVKIERSSNNIYVDAASWKQTTSTGGGTTVALSKTIASGTDDAEEEGADGAYFGPGGMYMNSSDLEITQDFASPSSGTQKIGMRFTSLTVPQGATITNATLKFKAIAADSPNSNSSATSLTIKGQAADNATTFTTTVNNISSRTLTSASAAWSPSAWTTGTTYSSPDLSTIVQEIVNRSGWASGNSMAFVITGTGSRSTNSYDGSPSGAPTLEITYTTGGDNGYFVVRLDPTTFPPNSLLTTDNLETAVVLNNGDVDCANNFGLINHLPPVANPDTAYVDANTTAIIEVVANDSDPENTPLTVTILTNPPFGTASNNGNGSLNFTPNNGFLGWQTFLYQVCDAGTPSLCDTTTVSILVSPFVNDRPEAQDDYDTTVVNHHVETSVLLNDFDQEFGNLTASLTPGIQQPANGTVTVLGGGQIEYAPNPGFTGDDVYQYIVCDDRTPGLCDTARVFIHVKNQPPIARPDFVQTSINTPLNVQVLANDEEPDGHGIVILGAGTNATPSNGLTLKGGTAIVNTNGTPANYADDFITYTPPTGFIGVDTFSYRVRDTGTPNGFDITFVEIRVTALIDIELTKTVSPASTQIGQNVTFTLTLTNKGPSAATDVLTIDKLTSGYQYLSDNGAGMFDPATSIWYAPTLAVNQTRTLTITAKILNNSALKNVTEVYAADQKDIDSTPNNDDGDQSEDDEDSATPLLVELCTNGADDDGDGLTDCADPDCTNGLSGSISVSNATICTGGSATLTANGSGGTSPYTFAWSGGLGSGASKTASPASTTTYTVTVSDANGCTATAQTTVTVVADPAISSQPAAGTICNGGTFTLSVSATGGTPSLTYQWQSSSNNVSFANISGATASSYTTPALAATTYYRCVVSASGNGCGSATSNSAQVTVVADPAISAQPTSGTICNGGTFALSVTATGGTPSLIYQWQSSANNVSYANISGATASSYTTPALAATTYYRCVVSAGGNGCGSATSVPAQVTVVADPAISAQPAGFSECPGGTQSLSVTATGGTPSLTYQWQSSADNLAFSNIAGATATSYTPPSATPGTTYFRVVVSSAGVGCGAATSNSATVIILSLPVANAGADATICNGTSVNLLASASGGTSPYTFAWSNGLGAGAAKTVSPSAATTYTVTVTTVNGCTNSDQVQVSVNASPSVNAGSDVSLCLGQTASLTATASGGAPPYTFNWSNGLGSGNPKSATPLVTTTYTVTVTSNNGCIKTDQVQVTVQVCSEICNNGLDDDFDGLADCADPECGITVAASQDVSICSGQSATLTAAASPPGFVYTYSWSNSLGLGATKTVSPANTKTYTVTATSVGGCTATDEVTVSVTNCSELCANGFDDDSDGLVDCADPDCAAVGAPVLANDSYTTCPAAPFSERVSYNDGNLQNPVFSISTPPAYGTVTIDWTGKFNYVPTTFACQTDQFTYQVTNEATGCSSTAIVTLTLQDNTLPSLIDVPGDLILSCDDQVPTPALVQGFDACPGISIDFESATTQNTGGVCNSYTINREWTVTDLCGNVFSQAQNIVVEDQSAPQIFRIYTLENDGKVLAGISERVSQQWKEVRFPILFETAPVVLAQLVSDNDPAPATVQIRNVHRQGFELSLREEEAADGIHTADSVAWIAFEPGDNAGAGSPSGAGGDFNFVAGTFANVNHLPDTLNFDTAFSQPPLFLANLQSANESDPATVRYPAISGSSARFYLQEETSADPEISHASETLGFLAMEPGSILQDKEGEVFGEAGVLSLTNAWAFVPLTREYTKLVVVLGGLSNHNGQPLTLRVRNVTRNSFEARLEEWSYLDGSHPAETVSWVAMEGSVPASQDYYCSGDSKKLKVGTNVFLADNCDYFVDNDFEELESLLPSGLRTIRTWSSHDDCGNEIVALRTDTCGIAALRAKAFLLGAMVSSNGGGSLMRDDLRTKDLVPVVEPYSELPGFPEVENENAKVTICHHPGQPDQQTMIIHISQMQAHIDHGDVVGECEPLPVPLPPGASSAQFRTIADGAWTSASTWLNGNIPPVGNVLTQQISIEHHVTLASGDLLLKNNTKLWVTNGSLTVAAGNVQLQDASLFVTNAYFEVTIGYLYTWTGACKVEMKDSEVKIGANFSHESGWRKLENVCLSTGTDFVRGYALNVYDTLINVTGIVGGHFKNYFGGSMYLSNCKFKVVNGDFLNAATNTLTGNNLRLLLENGSILNSGTWTIPVVQLCVAGTLNVPLQYLLVNEDCANIATWFSSCNPGTGGFAGNGDGSSGFGGANSPSGVGGGGGGGGNTPANKPEFAGNGFLDPNLLDMEGGDAIVDWMLLELRSPTDEDEIVGYATVLLLRDGRIVTETGDSTIIFRGVEEGDYYVTIRHRNHLGVISGEPVFLSVSEPPIVDFTDPTLPVQGGTSAGRLENGRRLMWPGDFNEDGKVIYQGPANDVFALFMRVATDPGNLSYLANYIGYGYDTNDLNLDGKMIYQGPGNDRALVLFKSTLAHPMNQGNFANFVIYSYLP